MNKTEEYVKISLETYEKLRNVQEEAKREIQLEEAKTIEILRRASKDFNEMMGLVGEFLKQPVVQTASTDVDMNYGKLFNRFLKGKGYSLTTLNNGAIGISKDQ